MSLQAKIDAVLSRAFSYEETLKNNKLSEGDILKLRELVDSDETIPKCCTDRHVNMNQGQLCWQNN